MPAKCKTASKCKTAYFIEVYKCSVHFNPNERTSFVGHTHTQSESEIKHNCNAMPSLMQLKHF